jgi:hypothetical protein
MIMSNHHYDARYPISILVLYNQASQLRVILVASLVFDKSLYKTVFSITMTTTAIDFYAKLNFEFMTTLLLAYAQTTEVHI